MFVGIAEFDVFIPHSGSLKAKRSVVNGLKSRLQSRFRVAVSEVGNPELWQRASLGVAVVGAEPSPVEETLQAVRRMAESQNGGQIIGYRQRVVPWSFEE